MARGNRGSYGKRQQKIWASLFSSQLPMSANGTFLTSFLSFGTQRTILRMIGGYSVRSSGNVTTLENAKIVAAIGVASTDAVTLGATALPDPAEEPEYPWLYWQSSTVFFGATQSPGTALAGAPMVRRDFDIRSMRKISPRESLFMCYQYVDIVGAPGITVDQEQIRVLIGEH